MEGFLKNGKFQERLSINTITVIDFDIVRGENIFQVFSALGIYAVPTKWIEQMSQCGNWLRVLDHFHV